MVLEINEGVFDSFAKENDNNNFFQSSFYGNACKKVGYDVNYVGFYKGNELVGASLLLSYKVIFGFRVFYAPRGFLLDYSNMSDFEEFTKEIKVFIKSKKGIFVKINPLLYTDFEDTNKFVKYMGNIGYNLDSNLLESRYISSIDLCCKREIDLFTDMEADTSEAIKSSYNIGLKLKVYDEYDSELKKFIDIIKKQNIFNGCRIYAKSDINFYKELFEDYKGHLKICLVEVNIDEKINNLVNQKNEIRLKIVESRYKDAEYVKSDLEDKLVPIEKRLEELHNIKETSGNIINVAGGMFILWGNKLVNLFTVEDVYYQKFKAQYFLNFKMIKEAISKDLSQYVFYNNPEKFSRNYKKLMVNNSAYIPKELFDDKNHIKIDFDKDFEFARGFNSQVNKTRGEFTLVINKVLYLFYRKFKEVFNDRNSK